MKIHGYCEKCRRIKRVSVSSSGMVQLAQGRVAVGTCDACRDAADLRNAVDVPRGVPAQRFGTVVGRTRDGWTIVAPFNDRMRTRAIDAGGRQHTDYGRNP